MNNHSFELSFVKPSNDDLPGPGVSKIYLKSSSMAKDGLTSITPDCVNYDELDAQIKMLEKELSGIRERAKVMYNVFPK